jgi:Conserved hypothetical ATP binding protein
MSQRCKALWCLVRNVCACAGASPTFASQRSTARERCPPRRDAPAAAQVYNKVDVSSHGLPLQWMRDFAAFQRALDDDDSYAGSLSRSLSLVLDEFYENLSTVGVSSVTGQGMDELFEVWTCTLRLLVCQAPGA